MSSAAHGLTDPHLGVTYATFIQPLSTNQLLVILADSGPHNANRALVVDRPAGGADAEADGEPPAPLDTSPSTAIGSVDRVWAAGDGVVVAMDGGLWRVAPGASTASTPARAGEEKDGAAEGEGAGTGSGADGGEGGAGGAGGAAAICTSLLLQLPMGASASNLDVTWSAAAGLTVVVMVPTVDPSTVNADAPNVYPKEDPPLALKSYSSILGWREINASCSPLSDALRMSADGRRAVWQVRMAVVVGRCVWTSVCV